MESLLGGIQLWWSGREQVRVNPQHSHASWITDLWRHVSANLNSHTLHREEGSGHAAADKLSSRNAIIEHSS